MKKLLMLVVMSIMLVIIGISGQNTRKTETMHELYIPTNDYNITLTDAKVVHAGPFDIVRMDDEQYRSIKGTLPHIYGESISYIGDITDVEKVLHTKAVKVVERETKDGKVKVIGYSPYLKNSIKHNGKNVNIEIVFGNNMIEIGTPLIMGDY